MGSKWLHTVVTLVAVGAGGCSSHEGSFGACARGIELHLPEAAAPTARLVAADCAPVLSRLDLRSIAANALPQARARARRVFPDDDHAVLVALDALRPEEVEVRFVHEETRFPPELFRGSDCGYTASASFAPRGLPDLPPGVRFVAEVRARVAHLEPFPGRVTHVRCELLFPQGVVELWYTDVPCGHLVAEALADALAERAAHEAAAAARTHGRFVYVRQAGSDVLAPFGVAR